jgi:hypothetical protein
MKMMNNIQQNKNEKFSYDNQNFFINFYVETEQEENNLNKFRIK